MEDLRIRNRIKQFLILNACLLAFTLIMLWVKPVNVLRSEYMLTNRFDFAERVFVYGDTVLKQECDGIEGADAVELLMVNVNNSLKGSYHVSVSEDTGRIMGSFTEYKMDIPSDGLVRLHLKEPMVGGHTYSIELSAPDLKEDNALMVSMGYADLKAPGVGRLDCLGTEDITDYCVDKVLSLSLYKEYTNILAYIAIAVVFLIANFCLAFRDKGIMFLALPILIAAGIIMLLVLAPGSGPDDKFHYYSSYILSEAMMGHDTGQGVDNRYLFDFYVYDGYVGYNVNSSYIKVLTELGERITDEPAGYTADVWKEGWVNPLAHPASALGITIGKLLHRNFVTVYTAGRLLNMLLYVFLAYAAIRVVPVNKELMLLIAMTPMAMQQCCSMSYDSVINGAALLFVAYVLRVLYEKRDMRGREVAACVIMLAILAVVKVVYVVLALLLIPVMGRQIKKLIPALGIPAAALLILKWREIAAVAIGPGGDTYTVSAILRDPVGFVRLTISTLEGNGWLYLKGMIGNLMTGGFTPISEWFVLGYMIIIVLYILSESAIITEDRKVRGLLVITAVLGSLAVLLTFVLACTPVGSSVIMGVQGRYFLPFAAPVLYCLHGGRISLNADRRRLLSPIWFIELGYIACLMNQIYYDAN